MSLLIAVFFEAAEKGESVVLEVKNAICDFYSFPGQTGLASTYRKLIQYQISYIVYGYEF